MEKGALRPRRAPKPEPPRRRANRMEKRKKTNWLKVEIRLDIRIKESYNANIPIRFDLTWVDMKMDKGIESLFGIYRIK